MFADSNPATDDVFVNPFIAAKIIISIHQKMSPDDDGSVILYDMLEKLHSLGRVCDYSKKKIQINHAISLIQKDCITLIDAIVLMFTSDDMETYGY